VPKHEIVCNFPISLAILIIYGLLVLPFTLDKIGEEIEKCIQNLPIILIPYEISTKLNPIDTFVEVKREETMNRDRKFSSR
jgi:uncharacterized protein YqgV (UPF0045/DUF77 family)